MKTLSFRNFKVGYSEKKVLLDLNTEEDGVCIEPGIHLLVAPNGSGKSTLLRTMAGALPALSGKLRLGERDLLQDRDLYYVSEYLAFPKFIYPTEWVDFICQKQTSMAAKNELFKEMGLKDKTEQFLGRMSQGERRRVTWVAADLSEKPVLLLDEPLDGLDLLATESARKVIQRWKKQGRIVFLVVHQSGELIDLADRFWMISDEKLKPFEKVFRGEDWKMLSSQNLRHHLVDFYQKTLAAHQLHSGE
jgi:ABC-2 type transport system ATP-binding protein